AGDRVGGSRGCARQGPGMRHGSRVAAGPRSSVLLDLKDQAGLRRSLGYKKDSSGSPGGNCAYSIRVSLIHPLLRCGEAEQRSLVRILVLRVDDAVRL